MVHGFIYGLLVVVLLVTNLLHIKRIKNLNASIKWWRERCVKQEQELFDLKEKQNKKKSH